MLIQLVDGALKSLNKPVSNVHRGDGGGSPEERP